MMPQTCVAPDCGVMAVHPDPWRCEAHRACWHAPYACEHLGPQGAPSVLALSARQVAASCGPDTLSAYDALLAEASAMAAKGPDVFRPWAADKMLSLIGVERGP